MGIFNTSYNSVEEQLQMLRNWKLRDRTLLGFSVPTILIFVFSGMVYSTVNQIAETFEKVNVSQNAILATDSMALSMVNMDRRIRRYLLDTKQNQDSLERYKRDRQRFEEGLKLASSFVKDTEQKARLQKMNQIEKQFDVLVQETLDIKDDRKDNNWLANYLSQSKRIGDEFEPLNEEFTNSQQEILGKSIESTKATIGFLSLLAVLVSILSLAITVIVTSLIAKSLGGRIATVVKVAEQISVGNLTQSIDEDTSNNKDEVGQLLKAFKSMTRNLNFLIRQLQRSGMQVTTSATQIAASGKQLEATLAEQVASTHEVATAAREISATSNELVKTMDEVVVMSQATTSAANTSQKDLVLMEATMRQLAEATNSIAARLGVISEKANNINNIVVTITKVADQTNLLSLNAAIEAEKAGEYGLGFAVVAREIRRLADQTAVASLEIEKMVRQMQSSVSTGVMEMDKFAKEVGRSVENVVGISTQMTQIIEQVQDLAPRFESVNQGMETQSQGAQQISHAMMQLSNTSAQTADSLREINNAIALLNQVAQGLGQEISRFQIKVEDLPSVPLIHIPPQATV